MIAQAVLDDAVEAAVVDILEVSAFEIAERGELGPAPADAAQLIAAAGSSAGRSRPCPLRPDQPMDSRNPMPSVAAWIQSVMSTTG